MSDVTQENKKGHLSRTFRLSRALLDRLDAYSRSTGISRTFLVEKSLTMYLDQVEGRSSSSVFDGKG